MSEAVELFQIHLAAQFFLDDVLELFYIDPPELVYSHPPGARLSPVDRSGWAGLTHVGNYNFFTFSIQTTRSFAGALHTPEFNGFATVWPRSFLIDHLSFSAHPWVP